MLLNVLLVYMLQSLHNVDTAYADLYILYSFHFTVYVPWEHSRIKNLMI